MIGHLPIDNKKQTQTDDAYTVISGEYLGLFLTATCPNFMSFMVVITE